MMQSIHNMDNDNHFYEKDVGWDKVGRFIHYHYGEVGSSIGGTVDMSMDRYVKKLREKTGLVSPIC